VRERTKDTRSTRGGVVGHQKGRGLAKETPEDIGKMYPAPEHPDALMPPVTSLYTIRHNRGCWIGACELLRTPSRRSSRGGVGPAKPGEGFFSG
jgi:hypothetical protein